ncbi:MAG: MFS transporter [Planctomycetota bacterium]
MTDHPAPNLSVRKWAVFFSVAYAVQGFAQTATLLSQPINYFFKAGHNYTAGQLAGVTFWVTFPWYIKPVYGLLSDFVPFLGYRRRSYLIASSLLSFVAFAMVLGVNDPLPIIIAMIMTAVCTAFGDVMVDALMVEKGQAADRIKLFQGIQWVTISGIGILAAIGGGQLAGYADRTDDPIAGVHLGALIAMVGPAMLLVATWFIVREPRRSLDMHGMRLAGRGFMQAVKSKPLLCVVAFVCLFWFQPGLVTPMYLFCTEDLGISEEFYGGAGAYTQGGFLFGALLFLLVLGPRLSIRKLAMISIVAYATSTFAYLALVGPKSLIALSIFFGVCYMFANLTLLTLAAQVCPKHVEAFVFAFLMGLFNFVRQGSEWIGGQVYDQLDATIGTGATGFWSRLDMSGLGLDNPIHPLIVISGAVTLFAFLLVPLLPRKDDAIPGTGEDPNRDGQVCESCGYDLRGTPVDGACPECGEKRIARV